MWGLALMEDFRPSHGTVRFAAFELDSRASELRKQGAKVKLQEQPFQILQILLQRPGEIVTREELRQKIWLSDTFVDFDHGINNAIKRLREALGDLLGPVRGRVRQNHGRVDAAQFAVERNRVRP